jgi:PTH1 family peptidyl-tRNA hydrolase
VSPAVDWLVVGLGNPGAEYRRTRHNVGFMVAESLIARWGLATPKPRYRGLITEGRIGTPGVDLTRVALLAPQTYMNDTGQSVGPARGALGVDLDHVLVVHDEIDLPFGEIRVRLGGGLAGHNGLKSIRTGLGSTDPERVAAYVLGRFCESPADVQDLVQRAADATERAILDEPS